jgi:stress-induced morphogen
MILYLGAGPIAIQESGPSLSKLDIKANKTERQVQDISGGCGSMYAVSITTERFKGLPVIKQHRLVNGVLGEDIKSWHGIQLKTKAP